MRLGFKGIFQVEIGLRNTIQAELRSATGDIIAVNTFYEPGQMAVRLHGCDQVVNVLLDPTRVDEIHSGAVQVDRPINIVDPLAVPPLETLYPGYPMLLANNGTFVLGEMTTQANGSITSGEGNQILVLSAGEQWLVNFMVGKS